MFCKLEISLFLSSQMCEMYIFQERIHASVNKYTCVMCSTVNDNSELFYILRLVFTFDAGLSIV